MAKSKDDIKHGTAQAKLSEDETLRVAYKHGTPIEGGKIADSEPVDLFSSAHNIANKPTYTTPAEVSNSDDQPQPQPQPQPQRDNPDGAGRKAHPTSSHG